MTTNLSVAGVLGSLLCALGGAAPANASPPGDPCSLLTPAQVSGALGIEVGAGQPIATTVCEWGLPGAPSLKTKKVTVTLESEAAFANAKLPVGHGIIKVPATGIGDDAVFGTTPKYATTLAVKKGDVYFIVHVWGFPLIQPIDVDDVQAKEKMLAMQILSKL